MNIRPTGFNIRHTEPPYKIGRDSTPESSPLSVRRTSKKTAEKIIEWLLD